jgi:SAM-dependent methyltransferase
MKALRRITHHGRFLEIGIGAGDFLHELVRRGWEGTGIDLSQEAVEHARARLGDVDRRVAVEKRDFRTLDDRFGTIFAFEVIEHQEDDENALGKLHGLLAREGYLILSVPARMKHWGANDDWAGHARRYERNELKRKAEAQGFETISIDSFGVPIVNILKIFYDRMISKRMRRETELSRNEKIERSWEMPVATPFQPIFAIIFSQFVLYPFLLMQCLFLKTDLGTSYLAVFRKK